jgi:hypothetical protein
MKNFFLLILILCAKFVNAQDIIWHKMFPTVESDLGFTNFSDIVVDSKQNIYANVGVVDCFLTDDNFQADTLCGAENQSIMICKFDSNKNMLWHVIFGNGYDLSFKILLDKNENVLVMGLTSGVINLGLPNQPYYIGDSNTIYNFIVKYDPNGKVLWAKNLGGNYDLEYSKIECDKYNNYYILPIARDSINVTSDSTNKIMMYVQSPKTLSVLIKYDSNGNYLDSKLIAKKRFSGNLYADFKILDDGLVFYSQFYDTLDADPSNNIHILYPNIPKRNSYIMRLKSNFEIVWIKHLECKFGSILNGFAINKRNDVLISGVCGDSLSIDNTFQLKKGANFLMQIDSIGNINWFCYSQNTYAKSNYSQTIIDKNGNNYFSIPGGINSVVNLFTMDSITSGKPNGTSIIGITLNGAPFYINGIYGQVSQIYLTPTNDLFLSGLIGSYTSSTQPSNLSLSKIPYYIQGLHLPFKTRQGFMAKYNFFDYVPNSIKHFGKLNTEILPNPFTTILQVNNTQLGDFINIYNIQGQLCLAINCSSDYTSISTNNLQKGFYILELRRGEQTIQHKIIKQ